MAVWTAGLFVLFGQEESADWFGSRFTSNIGPQTTFPVSICVHLAPGVHLFDDRYRRPHKYLIFMEVLMCYAHSGRLVCQIWLSRLGVAEIKYKCYGAKVTISGLC